METIGSLGAMLFFGFLSCLLGYFDMSFRTFSGLKIRVLLGPGEEMQGGFPDLVRIKMSLQLALFVANTPLLLLLYYVLQQHLRIEAELLLALTAFGGAGIVTLLDMAIPGLLLPTNRDEFSKLELRFLRMMYLIFSPLIWPTLTLISKIRERQVPEAANGRTERSEEEIQDLIEAGEEEGLFSEEERELLHSVVEFSETVVGEVMVPRTEMDCVQLEADFDTVRAKIIEGGHSRLPVYKDTVDNIVGVVNVKDLVIRWDEVIAGQVKLSDFIREPYFIPETKRVNELLREFQRDRIQMAIVVDEYGGVEGLVTLEDLLEELVGDIQDEYDRETEYLHSVDSKTVIVDGRIDVEQIEEHFDIELPDGDFETVGGFIFLQLGRVPMSGEVVVYKNLQFEVVTADERRIFQVRVTQEKPRTANGEEIEDSNRESNS